jgi:plastocyanin
VKRPIALLAAVAAALCTPAAAGAAELTIRMPGKYFDPPASSMVAGDTAVFRNNDPVAVHNVRMLDGVFESGPIGSFTMWTQRIDQPGTYPFVCTLHAFMNGTLDVVAATLAIPPGTVLAGEPIQLSGRAAAGTTQLALERSTPEGGWVFLAAVPPAPDGTFAATARAVEGASFRVTTAAGASPPVTPNVTARIDVRLDVRRSRRARSLRVHAMPAPAGFVATLERYSPWRFSWRTSRRVKLDAEGRARFRLRSFRHGFARVALSRSARGPSLVRSHVVELRTGRTVRDPESITPPGPGHGGADGGAGQEEQGGGHGGH